MFTAAFAAQDQHPAAELAGDPVREFLQALFDGVLVEVDLAGGIGDDQAALLKEAQDVPGTGAGPIGGQGPDVGFVDRGVCAGPGQQDPQAAGGDPAHLLVQCAFPDVLLEVLEQGIGGRREGRELAECALGQAAPVPAGLEQRALRGVDQVG